MVFLFGICATPVAQNSLHAELPPSGDLLRLQAKVVVALPDADVVVAAAFVVVAVGFFAHYGEKLEAKDYN